MGDLMKMLNGKILVLLFVLLFMGMVFAAAPDITQTSYDPSPAVPGSTIQLFLQLENKESNVKTNVEVSVISEFPFLVKDDSVKVIGDMGGYSKSTVLFTVYIDPSAENKSYPLKVSVSTDQDSGKTVPIDIFVSGKEPNVRVVQVSPSKLIPGEEKQISLVLQNIGTSTAYDVLVELQEDRTITAAGAVVERQILPLGSATKYIAEILPGEQATVTMNIAVNREADLKNYTIPVTISYRNPSGTRDSTTSYAGFKVSGDVALEATLKDLSTIAIAGNETTATIELFNKGAGKAEFMITSVTTDCGASDGKKEFIGSLEPNDVDSFRSVILINSDVVTGECMLNVNVEYQDTDASTKNISIPLSMMVYSESDGAAKLGGGPDLLFILIVLIVLGGAGYWYYKKKKKTK
jgi:hypothetical protein